MYRKTILILGIMFTTYFKLAAQTDTSQTRSIMSFSNGNYDEPEYHRIAIKLGLFDIFAGMYGLHVEKELGSTFSLQVGAGMSGRNYMTEIFQENFYLDSGNQHYNYDHRTSTPGYFISLQPKLYFNEYGFDENYLFMNFSQRRYGFNALTVDNNAAYGDNVTFLPGSKMKEHENQRVFSIGYGHQWLQRVTALDMGLSAGLKSIKAERRNVTTVSDPNSGYITGYSASLMPVQKQEFYFEWFFRVGINFKPKS